MTLMPGTTASARPVRALLATALSVAVAAGTLTLTTAPAAANSVRYEQNNSWAYTDAHRPTKVTIGQAGDVPVGSWKDDRGVRTPPGRTSPSTSPATGEPRSSRRSSPPRRPPSSTAPSVRVWSCGAPRRTPPGRVGRSRPPSWPSCTRPRCRRTPAAPAVRGVERGRGPAPGARRGCLDSDPRAPAAGRVEADPTLGRRYASTVGISVDYNYPPGVPTELQTSGKPCTVAEPYQLQLRGDVGLSAVLRDQDRNETGATDLLTATVALWPVDEPAARIERTGIGRDGERESVLFDGDSLIHDRVYAWQVRAADSRATGEWSAVCYFRTDFQGPTVAPVVTSPDFPVEGWHPALPGRFTFDATATPDAVGFRYQLNGQGYQTVAADRPGGSATVTLTRGPVSTPSA
ncbi:hypothetical protein NKG94_35865 [Micromonospora sp. M12]